MFRESRTQTNEQALPVLPKELLPYVSPQQLIEQGKNHRLMTMELTERQKEQVKRIKAVLLEIPLIHASSHPSLLTGTQDLLPADDLPKGHYGHSHTSDRSLGLTRCVFFGWGLAEKGYGRQILQISPTLLDSANVFVTPTDIGHIELAEDIPFEEYEPERKERIKKYYFEKMVTGSDWVEITARKILETIEEGESFFPLRHSYSLGEIKHVGAVPAKYIVGSFPVSDLKSQYRFLYEHGFSFTNMEGVRNAFINTGQKQSVDPLHEECGINYEEVSTFWKKRLEI